MNTSKTIKKVNKIIEGLRRSFDGEVELNKNAKLADLGFDDLDILEFFMLAEKKFEVIINEDEEARVKTLGDIYKLIDDLLKQ